MGKLYDNVFLILHFLMFDTAVFWVFLTRTFSINRLLAHYNILFSSNATAFFLADCAKNNLPYTVILYNPMQTHGKILNSIILCI